MQYDYRDPAAAGKLFNYENQGRGITIKAISPLENTFMLEQEVYDTIPLDGDDFSNFNQAKYVFTPKPVKLKKGKYYYFVVHADGDVMTILTEESVNNGILEIFNQPLLHKHGKSMLTYLFGDLESLTVTKDKKIKTVRDHLQGAK